MLTIRPTLDICGVGHPWAPAQCHWVEGWGRSQGFHPRSPTGSWISFLCPRLQVGLDVILRPGPFIDAERDFGGLPYWLLKWAGFFGIKNPSPPREGEGKLRTSEPKFLARVRSWYVKLFSRWTYFFAYKYPMSTSSRLQGLFFHQGGPIIMVQVGWEKSISSQTTGCT